MILYSLLDESLVSTIERVTQHRARMSLPAVLAALVRDEIDDFPALRPHQRHVWHSFLVQLAALHLHRRSDNAIPDNDAEWRRALLSLTPDDQDGAAWALISPVNRPALLQPPVVGADSIANFNKSFSTPDEIDLLVSSKHHEIKRDSILAARPEHWLFSLLSLQTQEGYMGVGNYGISRMNTGRGSRPSVGVSPRGGPGRRFVRDATRLIALRARILDENPAYPSSGGSACLWLQPWDGKTSLLPSTLDPFYIEICRRIRLQANPTGQILARAIGTKCSRIEASALRGQTGDGWTPLTFDATGAKSLTVQPQTFGYRKLVPLLFPRIGGVGAIRRAPLQVISSTDDQVGLTITVRGVVRGEGETQGYYERQIAVSTRMRRLLLEVPADEGAAMAEDRVNDAGLLALKVLSPAVLGVYTASPLPNERRRDDDTAKDRTNRTLKRYDQFVDASFFSELSRELEVLEDPASMKVVRATWLVSLMDHARTLLDQCALSAPSAAMRSYRTRARTRDQLEYAFLRHFGERVAAVTPTTGPGTSSSVAIASDFHS